MCVLKQLVSSYVYIQRYFMQLMFTFKDILYNINIRKSCLFDFVSLSTIDPTQIPILVLLGSQSLLYNTTHFLPPQKPQSLLYLAKCFLLNIFINGIIFLTFLNFFLLGSPRIEDGRIIRKRMFNCNFFSNIYIYS